MALQKRSVHLFFVTIFLALDPLIVTFAGNFFSDCSTLYGDGRVQILQNGNLMSLSVDQVSGSGFESQDAYLYGKFDMQIKLVPGNSAGLVTSFYLHSNGTTWDEIDIEFLGNLSGYPYVVHTNIFTGGQGNREQQFYLWFDPTADFHTYSILWNPQHIVIYVDGTPIREFKNLVTRGVPYPQYQPMTMYSTIWNADSWATRGGLVKTDWALGPFTAYYTNFEANACIWSNGASSCGNNPSSSLSPWFSQELDSTSQYQLQWVQNDYMIYNYCTDVKRFPQGFPPECSAI